MFEQRKERKNIEKATRIFADLFRELCKKNYGRKEDYETAVINISNDEVNDRVLFHLYAMVAELGMFVYVRATEDNELRIELSVNMLEQDNIVSLDDYKLNRKMGV